MGGIYHVNCEEPDITMHHMTSRYENIEIPRFFLLRV